MKDFDIRKYVIPLRKDGLKAPLQERSKRTIVTIKKFIEKHTRAQRGNVLIGAELNEEMWGKGARNPPTKVKVFVQKLKDDKVFVNLEGAPVKIEAEKKEDKEKKGKKGEKDEGLEELTEEFKTEKEKKKAAKDNTPSKKKN